MQLVSSLVKGAEMMLLVIDNYDSFTYNIVQYLEELGSSVLVRRNDKINLTEVRSLRPTAIVLSPGPCTPDQAGICLELVLEADQTTPVLGVCLGHQCIGQAFGAKVVRAPVLMHGKTSLVHHNGRDLYRGLPNPFTAARYHSLVVARSGFPEELEIAAWTETGDIMGIRHVHLPLFGVQFHPESIMTDVGKSFLGRFMDVCSTVERKVLA